MTSPEVTYYFGNRQVDPTTLEPRSHDGVTTLSVKIVGADSSRVRRRLHLPGWSLTADRRSDLDSDLGTEAYQVDLTEKQMIVAGGIVGEVKSPIEAMRKWVTRSLAVQHLGTIGITVRRNTPA